MIKWHINPEAIAVAVGRRATIASMTMTWAGSGDVRGVSSTTTDSGAVSKKWKTHLGVQVASAARAEDPNSASAAVTANKVEASKAKALAMGASKADMDRAKVDGGSREVRSVVAAMVRVDMVSTAGRPEAAPVDSNRAEVVGEAAVVAPADPTMRSGRPTSAGRVRVASSGTAIG
ncbi:MAG: hypothetical protein B7Y80_19450 [Hyphomicrobium sp. 32-62-53]|nr:MAG: hypothetical protein B7Z29_16850 [Hyphomicrobium sp. 12-62-95]OYX97506.1 MAG: hypothetical protein B7Y80_19450 [Hyphomicrobium sp. 32-62-53]